MWYESIKEFIKDFVVDGFNYDVKPTYLTKDEIKEFFKIKMVEDETFRKDIRTKKLTRVLK